MMTLIRSFCVVMLVTLSTNVASANLIAYWDFDSNTGPIVTDVENGLTGVMNNASLTAGGGGFTGVIGNEALDLTAGTNTGDMTVASAQFIPYNPGANSFSVSMWAKYNSYGNLVDHAGTNGYDFGTAAGNNIEILFGEGGSFGTGWTGIKTDTSLGITVGQDQWHHIAMVADQVNDTIHVYVDGVEAAAYAGGSGPNNNEFPATIDNVMLSASNLVVGRRNGSGLNGYIDDYAIYSIALNEAQVAGLANGTLAPNMLEVSGVPEPASIAMLGLGLIGLGWFGWRRRRS